MEGERKEKMKRKWELGIIFQFLINKIVFGVCNILIMISGR